MGSRERSFAQLPPYFEALFYFPVKRVNRGDSGFFVISGMYGASLNLLNCRVQSKSEIFEDYGLMKFEPGGFARGTSVPANHRREYIRNPPPLPLPESRP